MSIFIYKREDLISITTKKLNSIYFSQKKLNRKKNSSIQVYIYTLDEFHLTQSLKTESYILMHVFTPVIPESNWANYVGWTEMHLRHLYFTTLDKLVCYIIDYTKKSLDRKQKLRIYTRLTSFLIPISGKRPTPLPRPLVC